MSGRLLSKSGEQPIGWSASNEHGVWAVEDHHVVRIDPSTDQVTSFIRFPRGTEPRAIASTPTDVSITVGNPNDGM